MYGEESIVASMIKEQDNTLENKDLEARRKEGRRLGFRDTILAEFRHAKSFCVCEIEGGGQGYI
jgi:hypothetical protein